MKKIIYSTLTLFRNIKKRYATFWMKQQLESYGEGIGAARIPLIARTAKVRVGSNVGFNGMTISGLGGGDNRKLFSFWC